MDISAEKYKPDKNQLVLFSAVMQTVKGIFRRLTGFFTLTEEEKLQAGIQVGSQGRDE
jgi:hypothetical protein